MKRHTRRWILLLGVLAALLGCRAFGLAKAADQKDERDAQIVEADAQEVRPNAAEVETAPEQVEATARPAQATSAPVETTRRPVEKPTTSIPRGGCVTAECHPGVKAAPFIHGPVAADVCHACHEELDASKHTFEWSEAEEELCASCHELELEEKYVHQPAADGQCAQCHNPHGGQDRSLLRGGAGAAACAECHDDVTEEMPVVHGPVAAGVCTACHRPHSSDHPKLLTRPGRDLCLECHLTVKKRLETVGTVHAPAAGDCTACHLPHAAEEKMLLTAGTTELCLDCHAQIEDLIEDATTKHDPVSTGRACGNCHSPHGSDYAAMLINDMVEVCLSCHDREIELADGTALANMRAVLEGGKSLHGPIAQRNCTPCHQSHGGSEFRLLLEEYPPRFYAPFREESYGLCFECHDVELVLDPRTDELTDFRNGDRNLHYLHVNKQTKGRTCRACHETHASNKAKHIRDWVPFGSGGWKLPINFEKTETGGRCGPGCHRPYGYDRVNPVAYKPLTGPATWPEAKAPTAERAESAASTGPGGETNARAPKKER